MAHPIPWVYDHLFLMDSAVMTSSNDKRIVTKREKKNMSFFTIIYINKFGQRKEN